MEQKIDLMIIGAQKAGTTALNNYLSEHHQLLGHPQTEFGYFIGDELYSESFDKVFSMHFTKGDIGKAKAIVAKSTGVYENETAIHRLYQHNPECKLVFLIREPVSRAISSFNMEVFNGLVKENISGLKEIILKKNFDHYMYRYFIRLGLYSEHLKNVFKFFRSDQVKIILYENFKENPESVCKELFRWLDVNPEFVPQLEKKHNVSAKPVSKKISKILLYLRRNEKLKNVFKTFLPYWLFTKIGNFLIDLNRSSAKPSPISNEIKAFLKEYFHQYNDELIKMTDLDLSLWGHKSIK
ncbi:MAG: sulfotransferase [Cyclobacteriaceae bacterium]